jgi:hypothetical protein
MVFSRWAGNERQASKQTKISLWRLMMIAERKKKNMARQKILLE